MNKGHIYPARTYLKIRVSLLTSAFYTKQTQQKRSRVSVFRYKGDILSNRLSDCFEANISREVKVVIQLQAGALGYIAGFFVERFLSQAPEGLCRGDLLRTIGLPAHTPIEPDQKIRDADFFDLLEQIAAFDAQGRSVAVRVGNQMRCDDYGAFGLAFKSAVTLLSSFKRVERFGKVVTSIANYSVDRSGSSAFMRVHKGESKRLGLFMTNELAVAAASALSREVSIRAFVPTCVSFAHAAPTDLAEFERVFECPIYFGAEHDGLEIADEHLNIQNRLGDEKTSEFFDLHLEKELASLTDDTGLAQRVRIQVSSSLSEGVPLISDIASRLGMSGRSLQRRLSDSGYAYQEIVDDARRTLAERLLRTTEFSLAEVAFLTGYSEQSTFSKAFKRWNGQSPRSYRLTAQSLPN